MRGKIEPGCLAIIIESIFGKSVGTIVQCIRVIGTHSEYGIIWRVRSNSTLISEYGGTGLEVDVAEKWLKKIDPDEKDNLTKEKKILEVE